MTKAAIVLLLGWGLFHFMRKNLDEVAERVVEVLHVNPEGKLSNLFFELASYSSGRNLWVLALGTLAYASVGLTGAYGLWRERDWAQWFSLLSTALYLPPELYWMLRDPSWLKCAVLVTNIAIFLFMLSLRVNGHSRVVRSIRLQSSMRTGDQSPAGNGSGVRSRSRIAAGAPIIGTATKVEDRHRTSDGKRKWNQELLANTGEFDC
jgi:uncharacterized membrane protein (DUF2068 family)